MWTGGSERFRHLFNLARRLETKFEPRRDELNYPFPSITFSDIPSVLSEDSSFHSCSARDAPGTGLSALHALLSLAWIYI